MENLLMNGIRCEMAQAGRRVPAACPHSLCQEQASLRRGDSLGFMPHEKKTFPRKSFSVALRGFGVHQSVEGRRPEEYHRFAWEE